MTHSVDVGASPAVTEVRFPRAYVDQLTDIGAKTGALVFARIMIELIVAVLEEKFGFPFDDVPAAVCALLETDMTENPREELTDGISEQRMDDFLREIYGAMVE